jgi:hypothetical protein
MLADQPIIARLHAEASLGEGISDNRTKDVTGDVSTYFLNRLPLMLLSFFVQGLMISSEGET